MQCCRFVLSPQDILYPAVPMPWCLSHKFGIDSSHLSPGTHPRNPHRCVQGFDSVMSQPDSLHLCGVLGRRMKEGEKKRKNSAIVSWALLFVRMSFRAVISLTHHLLLGLSLRWLLRPVPLAISLGLLTLCVLCLCSLNFPAHLKGLKGYSSNEKISQVCLTHLWALRPQNPVSRPPKPPKKKHILWHKTPFFCMAATSLCFSIFASFGSFVCSACF